MGLNWAAALCMVTFTGIGMATPCHSQGTPGNAFDGDAVIRLQSYRQIENALAVGRGPEDWDASVFLSSKAVDRLAQMVPGTIVPLAIGHASPVKVAVESADFTWSVGAIEAKLRLSADYGQTGAKLNLAGDALFVVSTIEHDPAHADGIILVLEPRILSIRPGLNVLGAAVDTSAKVADLLGWGLTAALKKKLQIKVPLRNSFAFSTKIGATPTLPVRDDVGVTFQVSSIGEDLKANLIYRPIVTPDGIWALATVASPGQEDAAIDPVQAVTDEQISQLDNEKSALSAKLAPYAGRSSDVAIHVSSEILQKIVARYNGLATDKRAITARSTNVSGDGNLYEQKWRDNLLGDGGVFVWLESEYAANGALTTDPVTGTWDNTTGTATINVSQHITASADIHLHVDPLIGGGAGTTVKILGSTAGTLRASASLQTISTRGQSGLFALPDLPCQEIRINARTNGHFMIGPLQTDVPSIGANVSFAIGIDQLKPYDIADSLPRAFPLGADVERRDGFDGMQVTLSNFEMKPAASGTWVGANFAVSPVVMSQVKSPAVTADDMATEAQASLGRARQACNIPQDLEIVVGDIAIGQNNEFVKFFRAVAKSLEDVAATASKAGQDVATALAKATQDTIDTADKARRDTQAAAAKAASDAAAAADKAQRDTAAAAAKAAQDAINAADKARRDAEATAAKAAQDAADALKHGAQQILGPVGIHF